MIRCHKCTTVTIHRHCDNDQHDENEDDCENYINHYDDYPPCISNHEDDQNWHI